MDCTSVAVSVIIILGIMLPRVCRRWSFLLMGGEVVLLYYFTLAIQDSWGKSLLSKAKFSYTLQGFSSDVLHVFFKDWDVLTCILDWLGWNNQSGGDLHICWKLFKDFFFLVFPEHTLFPESQKGTVHIRGMLYISEFWQNHLVR